MSKSLSIENPWSYLLPCWPSKVLSVIQVSQGIVTFTLHMHRHQHVHQKKHSRLSSSLSPGLQQKATRNGLHLGLYRFSELFSWWPLWQWRQSGGLGTGKQAAAFISQPCWLMQYFSVAEIAEGHLWSADKCWGRRACTDWCPGLVHTEGWPHLSDGHSTAGHHRLPTWILSMWTGMMAPDNEEENISGCQSSVFNTVKLLNPLPVCSQPEAGNCFSQVQSSSLAVWEHCFCWWHGLGTAILI